MKIQLKKLEKRNHSQKIYYRHPQQLSAQSEIYVFLLISQPYFASTFFFFLWKPITSVNSHWQLWLGSTWQCFSFAQLLKISTTA